MLDKIIICHAIQNSVNLDSLSDIITLQSLEFDLFLVTEFLAIEFMMASVQRQSDPNFSSNLTNQVQSIVVLSIMRCSGKARSCVAKRCLCFVWLELTRRGLCTIRSTNADVSNARTCRAIVRQ